MKLIIILIFCWTIQSCNSIGMLLFGNNKATTIYRSSSSSKDYFTAKASNSSSCGCTMLIVQHFNKAHRTFTIFYSNGFLEKIFPKSKSSGHAIRLVAVPHENFTVKFDALDIEILSLIDSLASVKVKGINYPIIKTNFRGYIEENLNN